MAECLQQGEWFYLLYLTLLSKVTWQVRISKIFDALPKVTKSSKAQWSLLKKLEQFTRDF